MNSTPTSSSNPLVNPKDQCGTFCGNNVKDWFPIQFAIEFIFRMRQQQEKLLNIPSTRQAVAIPKFLTAIYYRKRTLFPEDYITAAKITTPIEDQDIAEEIASKILFPNLCAPAKKANSSISKSLSPININPQKKSIPPVSTPKKSSIPSKSTAKMPSQSTGDFMEDLLADISEVGFDLSVINSANLIAETIQQIDNASAFLDDLYARAARGEQPYQALTTIIDQRNGFREILNKAISTISQLEDYVEKIIQQEINTLTPPDVMAAIQLGLGNQVINQTQSPWIKIAAQYCTNTPGIDQIMAQQIQTQDIATAAHIVKYLADTGYNSTQAAQFAQQLTAKAEILDQINELSQVLGKLPSFDHPKIFANSINQNLRNAFQQAQQIDEHFATKIKEELFSQWAKTNPIPLLGDLMQTQTDVDKWHQLFEHIAKNERQKHNSSQPNEVKEMHQLAEELNSFQGYAETTTIQQTIHDQVQITAIQTLQNTSTPTEFVEHANSFLHHQIPLDAKEAINIGLKKGVPQDILAELFGGTYLLLKKIIELNSGSFDRYQRILSKLPNLNPNQMQELMEIAVQTNNAAGMGVLGHHNMKQAFIAAQAISPAAIQSLASSLTAGSGENLLKEWFDHRNEIPREIKDYVKHLVKEALLRIALRFLTHQRGSGDKGLIPNNQYRMYLDGDDLDQIDLDASIENIISTGKSPEMITSDDLLVQRTERGRVGICFLLDISGSMTGEKLAACALSVVILIGKLAAKEVAIALFESNTHVIKSFIQEKEMGEVADTLLDLNARGGTCVLQALQWAETQLIKCDAESKMCFLLTDCAFSEQPRQIQPSLQKMMNLKTKFILAVNTRNYDETYADLILNETKGHKIEILEINGIPKILCEVLEKIG